MIEVLIAAVTDETVIGIIGFFNYVMPNLTPKSVQFGVRIPPDRIRNPVLKSYTRRFRASVIVATGFLVILSSAIAVLTTATYFPALSILLEIFFMWLIYFFTRRSLHAVKIREEWTKGYIQRVPALGTQVKYPRQHTFMVIIPPLMVIALTAMAAVSLYQLIPPFIPLHFNGSIPSQFRPKSFLTVLVPVYFQVFVFAIFLWIFAIFRRMRIEPEYPDPARSSLSQIVFRRRLLISLSVMITSVEIGILVSGLSEWTLIPGVGSEISVVPILVGLLIMTLIIGRSPKHEDLYANDPETFDSKSNNNEKVMNRDDDKLWKFGSIYYNRSDPSFFIPKRFGVGYTINMGNPFSWILTVIIFVVLILLIHP